MKREEIRNSCGNLWDCGSNHIHQLDLLILLLFLKKKDIVTLKGV